MRICLISKYPPIEGGESSKAYWLAKAIAEKNHEVHIVTNAWEVENEYRELITTHDLDSDYQPKNVYVHNTNPFIDPFYIPYSKPYTEKIASLAIDIIKKFDLQLIDSWYILPYVISGYLAKTITLKPQIMRHAGSDMSRLLSSPYLGTLFGSVFEKIDKIVTYPHMGKRFIKLGVKEENLYYNTKVSVDTRAFSPKVKPIDLSSFTDKDVNNVPVITYIGKIGVTKGIFELIEAASLIKEDFLLLFVSKGRGLAKFKEYVKKMGLQNKTLFVNFLPPWRIPSVIKRSTCVVSPERNFPILQHTPILPREVMAVGKCLVLSNELYAKRRSLDIKDGKHLIVINPKDTQQFANVLKKIITHPDYAKEIGHNARYISNKIENFNEYVDDIIKLYTETINRE